MKTFELDKDYSIVCQWKKTRNGFKHTAAIFKEGLIAFKTKVCYLNRTWESYEYQTVLHKAIRKYFKKPFAEAYIKQLDEQDHADPHLKAVGMVMAFGDLLCETQKEKNDWKKRMVSTVPGIDIPEDFDRLPEEEKAKRLDGVQKALNE